MCVFDRKTKDSGLNNSRKGQRKVSQRSATGTTSDGMGPGQLAWSLEIGQLRARQKSGKRTAEVVETITRGQVSTTATSGRASDQAGKAVGVSGRTMDKAKVVREQGEQPLCVLLPCFAHAMRPMAHGSATGQIRQRRGREGPWWARGRAPWAVWSLNFLPGPPFTPRAAPPSVHYSGPGSVW